MIPGTMTTEELRIRELEMRVLRLDAALRGLRNRIGPASEDDLRKVDDYGAARVFIRAQAVGPIAPTGGNALGTGMARLLQVIGGARFKLQPLADGDVTVPCVQDTGGEIPDRTYMILSVVDGRFTVIVADCVTAMPAVAPDPPTS